MNWTKNHTEYTIHLLFWLFYFASVNVNWTADWFDASLRPNTPAALNVLIFPLYFYANAYWLIPRFLNRKNWVRYVGYSFLVFVGPEILRCFFYMFYFPETSFWDIIFGRDSFLFGAPSPFFLALNASFIYRFAKDWFVNQRKIKKLSSQLQDGRKGPSYQNVVLLTDAETTRLAAELAYLMQTQQLYLHPNLTLRDLAEAIDTSEKKLSYLLNQKLQTSFYDYLNRHRIEAFKKAYGNEDHQHLSIAGVALNCGFKSKSSFYRAFKASEGVSPAQYFKELE